MARGPRRERWRVGWNERNGIGGSYGGDGKERAGGKGHEVVKIFVISVCFRRRRQRAFGGGDRTEGTRRKGWDGRDGRVGMGGSGWDGRDGTR